MGRLFWKFFLSIWLAQVTAMLGIGAAFWLIRQSEQFRQHSRPPHMLEAVQATLHHAGPAAVREMLANHYQKNEIYIVDAQGRELFARALDPQKLNGNPERIRKQIAPDGQVYTVYYERFGPRPGIDGWNFRGMLKPGEFGPEAPRGRDAPGHKLSGAEPGFGPPPPAGPPRDFDRGRSTDQPRAAFSPPGPPGPPPEWLQLLPIGGTALASLIFAALLAWHFSTPIRSLREAFERVAGGDLAVRVGAQIGRRRDELAELGRDFDRMAERLATLLAGQRRLLHDVSHELRSPLARLQVAVGLLRQRSDLPDPQWERIEREAVRMDQLIGELLTLSRLEAGETGKLDETVDLDELLAAIVEDAQFEAQQSGRTISAPTPTGASLRGRGELLHRALENIVRNALKHTTAAIQITAGAGPARIIRIAVEDHGPGVPADKLSLIFEPFHRLQNSGDGHGLGLAIAKRIIEAHGGRVYAENRAGGGLRVVVELNCRSPD